MSGLAIALLSSVVSGVAAALAQTPATPLVEKGFEKLQERLRFGKYAAIDRALMGAWDDLLAECGSQEQRRVVDEVLGGLMESESSVLLDEFGTQVTQIYLFPAPNPPSNEALAKSYRQVSGVVAILNGEVPAEASLIKIFGAFFVAFRERLLREEDFSHLREYFQLAEARAQTALYRQDVALQQAILAQLTIIASNTARPVENLVALDKEYREYLIQDLKDHILRGFAPQIGGKVLSLPLAKIFLPLQAIEGRPALAEYAEEDLQRQVTYHGVDELDWQRWREEMEKRYTQLSVRQAAQRPLKLADLLKNTRAVLLGDPGSGKTTITRYITYALAAGDPTHVGKKVRHLVPVLVRIANYANAYDKNRTLHLTDYIEHALTPKPEFGRYLRSAIEAGACLIILDGLDEVTNTSLRMEITERIQKMVASYSRNEFLVTSRVIGYDQSPLTRDFTHATLQALTKEEQERFVQLWYEAISHEISERMYAAGADDLIDALRNKPQIARLAANPLLLTIMVLMHWRGIKLPSRRVQVYQNATDTLIEYWTAKRGVDLDAEEIKGILAPIAHHILSSNVGGVIAHHDLLPRFYEGIIEQRGCNKREAGRLGRQLLKDLGEQSGIFLERGTDSDDQPVYGFLHQTFGEYLAGLHMAEEMFDGQFELQQYIHRSMWHEPLLLMAGHLSIVSRGHTRTLIRDILAFPAPYEDTLQRNLLLAADCLADDIHLPPRLRKEVLTKLAEQLEHPAPQVQKAAVEQYKHLKVTRHREAAVTALQSVYPLDNLDAINERPPEIRLNLAKALLHLKERDAAQPILLPLEEQKHQKINQTQIQRLRFEHWPEEAADYLLELQADKETSFSIAVGEDLARSTLGPVDVELARNVLGETGLLAMIEELLNRSEDETDQARLRWLAALTPKTAPIEYIVTLLHADTYAYVRYLAAKHLLDSEHHVTALTTLHELTKNEPSQAPKAVRALLGRDEMADLNWQLLRDMALMPNHNQAPRAIATLLQAEDELTALPAALHLLATCSTETKRDYRRWQVVESLMAHDQTEVALAAARWLALQPGSSYRLKACNLLLENGQIEQAIPLLQILAYECHNKDALQACERLLMFKQTERVLPLLLKRRDSRTPARHYEACFALAQINFLSSDKEFDAQSYNDLRMAVLNERLDANQTVLTDFCQIGRQALDALEPTNEQTRSIIALGQVSLSWLAGSFDVSEQIKPSQDHIYPAVSLNMARFDLRAGHIDQAQQRLMTLLTKHDQSLSRAMRLEAIKTIGKIIGSETTELLTEFLTDQDRRIRTAAAYALGPRGDTASLQPLIRAVSDQDSKVRHAAISSLGNLGDPIATAPLINALHDKESRVRKVAARVLGHLGDPKALQPLIEALGDKNSGVRQSAAYALRDLDDPTALQPLMAALGDKESNVRKAAALALGHLGDSDAVQPLIALLSDKKGSVREYAADALKQLADSTAVQPLINALNDEKYKVRWYAAQALGKIGDSAALQPLMTLLCDDNTGVCYLAAYALRQLDDPITHPSLDVTLGHKGSDVDYSAVFALGQLGDVTVLPSLIKALNDKNKNVRSAAAFALGELGHLDGIQPLIVALDDEESSVRYSATFALGQLSAFTALKPLMIALGDEQRQVRIGAAAALGQIGQKVALQSLTTALNDKDKYVRLNAALALRQLGDRSAVQSLMVALIDNDDGEISSSVAKALSQIGGTEAIPLLVSIIPASRNAVFECARALIHLDPASAEPVLDRYARQFRRAGWIERLRGEMWWQLGDMEQALASFKKAIEKKHGAGELIGLAHFYLEQTDFESAQKYAKQALEKSPRTPLHLLSQAVIWWHIGKQADALERLNKARRIYKPVTNVKNLHYYHFWRERALTALEEMLAQVEA